MSDQNKDFSKLSASELEKCIGNPARFSPEDVEAAVSELEHRGRVFTFAELRSIEVSQRESRRTHPSNSGGDSYSNSDYRPQGSDNSDEKSRDSNPFDFLNLGKKDGRLSQEDETKISGETSDQPGLQSSVPSYYSPLFVSLFSLIFGTIYGVILMAINFNKTGNRKGVTEVTAFGVFYMIAVAMLYNFIHHGKPTDMNVHDMLILLVYQLAFNALGAFILYQFFWKRHIGDRVVYKSKPVLKPLLVCLAIVMFVALLVTRGIPA